MTLPEPQAVQARYAQRDAATDAARYSLYANAAAMQAQQERLRSMACIWSAHGWHSLAHRRLLEVGCGSCGNLLDLLRLGATPELLCGIELLPQRAAVARLPSLPLPITSSASVTTAPSTQPPDTEPRKLPSSSITRLEPTGRGAEPQVSTTVASATPLPDFRQSSAALRMSSSVASEF